jgi:phosphosulfolactate phosphohydrolase-like enzyme
MTISTKFEPGDRCFSVAKNGSGVWIAGAGTVTSFTITDTTTAPLIISYLIDADVGPDVTRREVLVYRTLLEAQDLADALNA